MKTYIYAALAVLLMFFTSCFDDKSEFGVNKISEIDLTKEIEEVYNIDKWGAFTLSPDISQSISDKNLNYEWQIDYKVVGTDKDLSFFCKSLGEFPCRLKVSNEDGAIFKEFKLNINSPYEEGLLLISKANGKSLLSFKRLDKEGYNFFKNVYSVNNTTIPLGSNPTMILNHMDYVYVGTTEPTTLVRMNSKTFEVSNILEYPGGTPAYAVMKEASFSISFFGDGTVKEYDPRQNAFLNSMIYSLPSDVILNDKAVRANTGYAFFDDNVGNLYFYNDGYSMNSLSKGAFAGKKMVDILACDDGENVLAILKDPSNNDPYMVRYVISTDVLEKNHNAVGTSLDINGTFLTSSKSTVLYYSSGNKVYAYNYLANNFPNEAFITVEDSEAVIKTMLFDDVEGKIYIAVNSGTGEFTGNVYCYDMNTKELLWKEESVAGEIIDMIYKR